MKTCTQQTYIEDEDIFQRNSMAEKMIMLLTSEVDISPMLIDGDWGTGKTVFCQKLITKFKKEHSRYESIYIDAFKADHADNPLMTVLAAIFTSIQGKGSGEKRKRLMEKAVPVLKFVTKSLGKAVIGHIFRQNADVTLSGLEEEMRNAANAASDAAIEATLKNHAEAESSICALKILLREVTQKNPMVIFVDELDRCRPDFAVRMLEVIKHIFDVDGVQFVLVTNTKQLIAAINHRYGATVDSSKYLDKFFKFSCLIPEELQGISSRKRLASLKHLNMLLGQSKKLKYLEELTIADSPLFMVIALIELHNLSLRDVEKITRYLEVLLVVDENCISSIYNMAYEFFGVFCFCMNPQLAQKIIRKEVDAVELGSYLRLDLRPEGNHLQHYFASASELVCQCKYGVENIIKINNYKHTHWGKVLSIREIEGWKYTNDILFKVEATIKKLSLWK